MSAIQAPGPQRYGSIVLNVDDLKLMRRLLRYAVHMHTKLDPAELKQGASVILAVAVAIEDAEPLPC